MASMRPMVFVTVRIEELPVTKLLEMLVECEYTCEGGRLENNSAFIELARRFGYELAQRAEETRAEMLESYGGVSAFVPGIGTVRECIDCGALIAGGPTRCKRCAKEGPPGQTLAMLERAVRIIQP